MHNVIKVKTFKIKQDQFQKLIKKNKTNNFNCIIQLKIYKKNNKTKIQSNNMVIKNIKMINQFE